MIGQKPDRSVGGARTGTERRRQYEAVIVLVDRQCAAGTSGIGAGMAGWRGLGEGLGVNSGFLVDDFAQGVWVQPRGRQDVGSALLFEEKSQPEGKVSAMRGTQGRGFALRRQERRVSALSAAGSSLETGERRGEGPGVWVLCKELTLSSSMLSSRWRGMTVTSSISARKETSAGVRPGGSGSAIAMTGILVDKVELP